MAYIAFQLIMNNLWIAIFGLMSISLIQERIRPVKSSKEEWVATGLSISIMGIMYLIIAVLVVGIMSFLFGG